VLIIPAAGKKKFLSSDGAVWHHPSSDLSTSGLLDLKRCEMDSGDSRVGYFARRVSEEQTDLTILLGAACLALAAIFGLSALATLETFDDPTYSVTVASSFG
jgi:hypothetical protein